VKSLAHSVLQFRVGRKAAQIKPCAVAFSYRRLDQGSGFTHGLLSYYMHLYE